MCTGLFIQSVPGLKEEENYLEGRCLPFYFLITGLPSGYYPRCKRKEIFHKAEVKTEVALLNIKPEYNGVCSQTGARFPEEGRGKG